MTGSALQAMDVAVQSSILMKQGGSLREGRGARPRRIRGWRIYKKEAGGFTNINQNNI